MYASLFTLAARACSEFLKQGARKCAVPLLSAKHLLLIPSELSSVKVSALLQIVRQESADSYLNLLKEILRDALPEAAPDEVAAIWFFSFTCSRLVLKTIHAIKISDYAFLLKENFLCCAAKRCSVLASVRRSAACLPQSASSR